MHPRDASTRRLRGSQHARRDRARYAKSHQTANRDRCEHRDAHWREGIELRLSSAFFFFFFEIPLDNRQLSRFSSTSKPLSLSLSLSLSLPSQTQQQRQKNSHLLLPSRRRLLLCPRLLSPAPSHGKRRPIPPAQEQKNERRNYSHLFHFCRRLAARGLALRALARLLVLRRRRRR